MQPLLLAYRDEGAGVRRLLGVPAGAVVKLGSVAGVEEKRVVIEGNKPISISWP
jgi:hypothetical protein